MGLDIWFAEDIRNALLAADEASAATAAVIADVGMAMGPQGDAEARGFFKQGEVISDLEAMDLLAVSLRAYRAGYKAALATVALAFGIVPQAITLRQSYDSSAEPRTGLAQGTAQTDIPRQP